MSYYGGRSGGQGRSHATVYTDGACTNNGYEGASAGVGVYWGNNDTRNVSEKCPGRQTNNNAEITAARYAVDQARDSGYTDLTVKTDSRFLVDCQTKWVDNWKSNGWKTYSGDSVKNRSELQQLDRSVRDSGMNVNWEHVAGHRGERGNEAADKLASHGAKKHRY